MRPLTRIAVLFLLVGLSWPHLVCAQAENVTDARAALSRGEYARAVNLLADPNGQPRFPESADAHLYLGVAYAHTREWRRAEDTFRLGVQRFPNDPRFHNELAGVYLAANDLDRARVELRATLVVDPGNKYATDLLATVDMSMETSSRRLDCGIARGNPSLAMFCRILMSNSSTGSCEKPPLSSPAKPSPGTPGEPLRRGSGDRGLFERCRRNRTHACTQRIHDDHPHNRKDQPPPRPVSQYDRRDCLSADDPGELVEPWKQRRQLPKQLQVRDQPAPRRSRHVRAHSRCRNPLFGHALELSIRRWNIDPSVREPTGRERSH